MEDDLAEWFENAPCGYLTLDDHGLVVRVNATFLKWIETSKAHVAGRHFSELLTLPGKIFYETHFSRGMCIFCRCYFHPDRCARHIPRFAFRFFSLAKFC